MANKEKTRIVAARLTAKLAEAMEEYCSKSGHLNISDFIRDAIREKILQELKASRPSVRWRKRRG
jgi:metal-responsive CopG/Arc/MetJ family transcriptional regulator